MPSGELRTRWGTRSWKGKSFHLGEDLEGFSGERVLNGIWVYRVWDSFSSVFPETEEEVFWQLLGKEPLTLLSPGQQDSLHWHGMYDNRKTSTATAILPPWGRCLRMRPPTQKKEQKYWNLVGESILMPAWCPSKRWLPRGTNALLFLWPPRARVCTGMSPSYWTKGEGTEQSLRGAHVGSRQLG